MVINMEFSKRTADEGRILTALSKVLPEAQEKCVDNEMKQDLEAETWLGTYPYCRMALRKSYQQRSHVGEIDQAIEGLIDAVVLEPTAGHYWHQLADLLARAGHTEESSAVAWIGDMQDLPS